jgi:glycerophosphoryl diester phosphodiesterase
VLNLDIKDVPPQRYVEIIRRMNAQAFVMLTVHRPEQAMYYLKELPEISFSAHVLSEEAFEAYNRADFPWEQCIAYIGPKAGNHIHTLYDRLHERGVSCMISAASSYDHLPDQERRKQAYRDVLDDGADILESDFPLEAGSVAQIWTPPRSKRFKYFDVMTYHLKN